MLDVKFRVDQVTIHRGSTGKKHSRRHCRQKEASPRGRQHRHRQGSTVGEAAQARGERTMRLLMERWTGFPSAFLIITRTRPRAKMSRG